MQKKKRKRNLKGMGHVENNQQNGRHKSNNKIVNGTQVQKYLYLKMASLST